MLLVSRCEAFSANQEVAGHLGRDSLDESLSSVPTPESGLLTHQLDISNAVFAQVHEQLQISDVDIFTGPQILTPTSLLPRILLSDSQGQCQEEH